MLPPSEDFEYDNKSSAVKSKFGGDILQSKFLPPSQMDDNISMRSLPMSTATRKSNMTMLTHSTFKSGMQQLPRDRKLREQAEQRIMKH